VAKARVESLSRWKCRYAGGATHQGRPLVIEELNELESMEKDLLCVCVYVSTTTIGT